MSFTKSPSYINPETALVHAGRAPEQYHGVVNPPVFRASTILFPTIESLEAAEPNWHSQPFYGRHGTPATFALEEAIADLEGGYRSVATSSGVAALTAALSAFVSSGDHILMVDTVYGPTRKYCDGMLKKFGVETTYYNPTIGADISTLFKPNTKIVYLEAPGSLTFEMQDIPAIAAAAKARGITVLLDNTWATPLHCKSFALGVDVSIHAGTKYIVGHSDALIGFIVAKDEETYMAVKKSAAAFGHHAAPDDVYLANRGLRTLAVRLQQHQKNALHLAQWLEQRSDVARVLYPALPSDAGHSIWQRDFTGASGLFGFVLPKNTTTKQVHAFVNSLKLFGIGFSWGGYESLVLPVSLQGYRTASQWQEGTVIRLHIGLENVADLQADLEQAFAILAKTT